MRSSNLVGIFGALSDLTGALLFAKTVQKQTQQLPQDYSKLTPRGKKLLISFAQEVQVCKEQDLVELQSSPVSILSLHFHDLLLACLPTEEIDIDNLFASPEIHETLLFLNATNHARLAQKSLEKLKMQEQTPS